MAPIPLEYQHTTEDFDRFLERVRHHTGLTTRNMAYTTVQGVLLVFRRRLTVEQGLAFAQILPPVLRALFVTGWRPGDTPPAAFANRAVLIREVQALRKDHNFSPDTAIEEVARALREVVDSRVLDAVLATFPEEARDYWSEGARSNTM